MSNQELSPWILLAEDDLDLSDTLTSALSAKGFRVMAATKAADAIAKARNQKFACIVLDLKLEKGSGEEVIGAVRADKKSPNAHTPILITSGFLDTEVIRRIGPQVAGVLVKPFDLATLVSKIEDALKGRQNVPRP